MKEKIALGVCLALTLVCAVGFWPEALFWSVPSNRHINQLNVFSHPLSLIWHWSLVVLPIPVALGFTRFRVSLVIAMALVLYTPIYLVWATLFTQHYRLAPGPLVWIVLFIITLAFELVFITRLKQLRKSNNRHIFSKSALFEKWSFMTCTRKKMKKVFALAILAACNFAQADNRPTIAELETQLMEKLIVLSQGTSMTNNALDQTILNVVKSVFSNHTDVVARQTEKLLAEMPLYDPASFPSDETHQKYTLPLDLSPDFEEYLILFGRKPERVIQNAKQAFLFKHLDRDQYSSRIRMESALPDTLYRLTGATTPTIVIISLADIFLSECKINDWGLLMPESITWFRRKENRTDEFTPTNLHSALQTARTIDEEVLPDISEAMVPNNSLLPISNSRIRPFEKGEASVRTEDQACNKFGKKEWKYEFSTDRLEHV